MQSRSNYEMVDLDSDIPVFMRLHTRGKTSNPRVIHDHWHRSIELNIIWEEFLLYYVNGEAFRLDKESVCLINSMDIHRLEPQSDNTDSSIVGFTLIIGFDFLKSLVADIEEIFFHLETKENVTRVQSFLYTIAEIYYKKATPYWKAAVMEQVCGLVRYLCEECRYSRDILPFQYQKNTEKVREMIEFVQKHYTENLTQQEVAAKFYFSREYFSRLFRKYVNCTFKEYLTRYRLAQAEKLLCNSSQSVLEIAGDVGFGNVKQFIQAFKKYYGITPLQYRKLQPFRG